jgi:hypothetical protein
MNKIVADVLYDNMTKALDEKNKISNRLLEEFIQKEFNDFDPSGRIKLESLLNKGNRLINITSNKSIMGRLDSFNRKFNRWRKKRYYLLDDRVYYIPFVRYDSMFLNIEFYVLANGQIIDLLNKKKNNWKELAGQNVKFVLIALAVFIITILYSELILLFK